MLVLLALGPAVFNDYWVNTILTQMFIFGIAAASLIFLSAYGAMTSLAQTALMGISAYLLGNMVTQGGAGGETQGLDARVGPDARARARARDHDADRGDLRRSSPRAASASTS